MPQQFREALGTALLVALSALLPHHALVAQSHARPFAPRLEPADCPFAREEWAARLDAECRWLVVPEDRARANGRSVRLFVVVVRSHDGNGRPPLVLLHGGPGESALLPMVQGAALRGAIDGDLVIYDQRGSGLSEPDPCPRYAARLRELEAGQPLGSERREALRTVARECVATMRAHETDPATFSTATNAADLVDLRRALGYARWDVYGASYGARLALEAMRLDPGAIRSAMLENPLPPGAGAEAPLSTQRALERVFAACGRDAACHAAFPAPEREFVAVFDTLRRVPLLAPAGDTGVRRIALDGRGFAATIRGALRTRDGIALLPMLLHELRGGDRARAARELLRLAEAGGGRPFRAAFWLVSCYDQYGRGYVARLDTVRSIVQPPLRDLGGNLEVCPEWQQRFAPPRERAPVRSDIPTLIVTGEFDPRTPLEFGRLIAATLSRAYLFEMPGETHGGRPTGCRARILAQFAQNPDRRPDASCISGMPSLSFRVRRAEP